MNNIKNNKPKDTIHKMISKNKINQIDKKNIIISNLVRTNIKQCEKDELLAHNNHFLNKKIVRANRRVTKNREPGDTGNIGHTRHMYRTMKRKTQHRKLTR